jgi:hypothetical protein
MSNNRYLDKILEDGLEKQAFIEPLTAMATAKLIGMGLSPFAAKAALVTGHAGLVHAGQNLVTHAAIRNKRFGQNVADHFQAGLQGKVAPSSVPHQGTKWEKFKHLVAKEDIFNIPVAAGAINPELNILRDEAYHAGHAMKKSLQDKGFSMDTLPKQVHEVMGHASKGNFSHIKAKYLDDPIAMKALDAFSSATGHPVSSLVRGTDAGVQQAERAWRDNPLTNNIASRMGEKRDLSHLADGHSELSTRKSLLGSALITAGTGDFFLGGLNAAKAVVADKGLVSALPYGSTLADKAKKFFVTDSIEGGLKKGQEGKDISKLWNITSKTIGSNLTAHGTSLANEMGKAHHAGDIARLQREATELAAKAKNIRDTYEKPVSGVIGSASRIVSKAKDIAKKKDQAPAVAAPSENKYLGKLGIGAGVLGGVGIGGYAAHRQENAAVPAY